jgi:hypothetical protein
VRRSTFNLLISVLPLFAVVARGQTPGAVEAFAKADPKGKKDVLAQIIQHRSTTNGELVAGIIRIALVEQNTTIRDLALTAVISRAAGPRFVAAGDVLTDWHLDHTPIQALRPEIVRLLRSDSEETVRVQAVGALASLDFNIGMTNVELTVPTQELLVQRFYGDASGMVRAKIVAGFGTDRLVDSAVVRRLFTDAFADPDHRVRHAAMSGVDKLDRMIALQLVVSLIGDRNRSVRAQAAAVLLKFGSAASNSLPQLEAALRDEQDPQVIQLLQAVIERLRPQR